MTFGRALRVTACLSLLLLVLSFTSRATPDNERRIALVVGISSYQSVPHLPNPVNDGRAVAQALQHLKFEVIELYDPNLHDLSSSVREFGIRAATADVAVVYYAGHGAQVNRENYLIPKDAKLENENDLQYEAMPLERLLNEVARAAHVGIVLLDSCRNNPFPKQMAQANTGVSRTVAASVGLARVDNVPRNTIVIMAAKADQIADDGGDHSPFAAALLAHLQIPGLELGLLSRSVRDTVLRATQNRQEPYTFSSLGADPFYFFPRPPNRPPEIGAIKSLEVTQSSGPAPLGIPEPSDPDHDLLTIRIIGLPHFGEVLIDGKPVSVNLVLPADRLKTATFTPDGKGVGSAGTFDILVEDGHGGSVIANLPINVRAEQLQVAAKVPPAEQGPSKQTDKIEAGTSSASAHPDMASPPAHPDMASPPTHADANNVTTQAEASSPSAHPDVATPPTHADPASSSTRPDATGPTTHAEAQHPVPHSDSDKPSPQPEAKSPSPPPKVTNVATTQRPILEFNQQQAAAVASSLIPQRLDVDAWFDRPDQTYRLGEPLTVSVRPRKDAYITVLNYGTSGRMTVVFPNQFQPDNLVRAGQLVQIPPVGAAFRLTGSGPPGVELLQIVASDRPLSLPEVDRLGLQRNDSPFLSFGRPAEEVAHDLVLQLNPPAGATPNTPVAVSKVMMVWVLPALENAGKAPPVAIPVQGAVQTGSTSGATGASAVGYDLPLTVRTDRNVYHAGDAVQITVVAREPCALTLLTAGPSGLISQLFPNAKQPSQLLLPGQLLMVPPLNSGLKLVAGAPPGIQTILGVCAQAMSASATALQQVLAQGSAPGGGQAVPRDLALVAAAQPDAVRRQAAAAIFITP